MNIQTNRPTIKDVVTPSNTVDSVRRAKKLNVLDIITVLLYVPDQKYFSWNYNFDLWKGLISFFADKLVTATSDSLDQLMKTRAR